MTKGKLKTNGITEFEKMISLTPVNNESIDWEKWEKSSLSSMLEQMSKTYQNPQYHGEVYVITHAKMVCEEMVKLDEYENGSEGVFGKTV